MQNQRLRIALSALALTATATLAGCATHRPLLHCEAAEDVTPVCGFQNPEDLVGLDDGWLLISQMALADTPGNLIAFRPVDGRKETLWPRDDPTASAGQRRDCRPPDAAVFAPHGIDLSRDGTSLLVVNHGGREAVERFRVDWLGDAPSLSWVGCVVFDDSTMLNDVAALPDGGFVVTEMMGQSALAPLGLLLGFDTGRVWLWSAETGSRAIPDSEARGPNGIAASPDGETLFVAEWGAQRISAISIYGGERRSVPVGFHPDNLSWTADGRLLAGGQIAGPVEATGCFDLSQGGCGLPSAVAAIDPDSLEVERIWTHDPATAAGGISAALERGDGIWLGAFGGDRIARLAR